MTTRIGNITVHLDDSDTLDVRPQHVSSDDVSDVSCVFVEGGKSVRLQLSGSHDALRALGHGIIDATTVVEQRKLAALVPVGQF